MTWIIRLALLLTVALISTIGVSASEFSGTSPATNTAPEESAVECSQKARDRYIEQAAERGLQIQGSGADAAVIARSSEQKIVLQ